MRNIRLSVLAAIAALLIVTLLLHLKGSLGEKVQNLTPAAQLKRAYDLVENVKRVEPGNTKDIVKRILGAADRAEDREWTYYLGEHSGYNVNFDGADRVVSVHDWLS